MTVSTKVVVSCVVFETNKIVQPIEYLKNVGRVYLVHWVSPNNPDKNSVYLAFFNRTAELLKKIVGLENIREIRVEVYDFKKTLSALLSIFSEEREAGNEVYVNVSSGTSEFSAAATLAAMMVPGVQPFTVRTKEWMVSGDERIRSAFFDDGIPIGQARSVHDPEGLPIYSIQMPDRELVGGLRLLDRKITTRELTTYPVMIRELRAAGLWRDGGERYDVTQKDKMYYNRHFIDPWIKNGWVRRKGRKLEMTDMGRMIIDVFYAHAPDPIIPELIDLGDARR